MTDPRLVEMATYYWLQEKIEGDNPVMCAECGLCPAPSHPDFLTSVALQAIAQEMVRNCEDCTPRKVPWSTAH